MIPQVEPYVTKAEGKALAEYLDSGGWLTEFSRTRELEESIASRAGAGTGICTTSGTVALYLALKAAGVGPGDKVAVPNFTMIASINAVVWCGAEPVLCDIDPVTLCADVETIPNPSDIFALVYVEINGRAGNLGVVQAFCEFNGIILIEDAAQAMGSTYCGKALGAIGLAGIHSFSPHKIITTGQGGIVLTNDEKLASRIRKLKDFHRSAPGMDVHDGVGYNFKFTDLQAVVGIEQFKTIDWRIKRKKGMHESYSRRLSGIIPCDLDDCAPWFAELLLSSREERDALEEFLQARGIGSRRFYPPINSQQPFSSLPEKFPVSEDIAHRGLWLPSSLGLDLARINAICNAVNSFLKP